MEWRTSALESVEQLRRAVSGSVGNDGPLSLLAVLSAAAAPLVIELFLFGASVLGGVGNVRSGVEVGGKQIRGERRRDRLCL